MSKPVLTQVVGDLPNPPYPEDTIAGAFGFDLQVDRAQNSDSWALCPPDVRPWMVMSWVMSWAQTPAGSLPNDDEIIASRLGCTPEYFMGHRKYIMRGWVLHSDDRLYHPVVTGKVLRLLHNRDRNAIRQGRHRKKVSEGKQEDGKSVTRESRVTTPLVTRQSPVSNSLPIPIPVPVLNPVLNPIPDPEEQIPPSATAKSGTQKKGRRSKRDWLEYTPEFLAFWKVYPKRKAKQEAMQAWANTPEKYRGEIMAHLAAEPFRGEEDRYIPHGATYLNKCRWEDEVITNNQKTGSMYL